MAALKQEPHAVLPTATLDEAARQAFLNQTGKHVLNEITPGNKAVYDKHVLPAFQRAHGRAPADRHEIRKEMVRQPYYQMTSSFQRSIQEMMWNSVDESIERQLPSLIATAKKIANGKTKGSLKLQPGFEIPGYIKHNDHHATPGGYSADLMEDDVTAGALYDRGAFIYTQGLFGARMDGIGKAAAMMIRQTRPDLKPKKILEIGCTAGGSTTGLAMMFPDAELHAIDVGPALLRYAHARAESWGVPIHFHQMNAEAMTFADESFDLVCCLASLHETSRTATFNIFKEARRVLKSGGLFLCSELPPYKGVDAWTQFVRDWDTYNNNEPYWGTMHELELKEVAATAGFDTSKYFEGFGPGVAAANALTSAVEVDNKKFMGSTRGGGQAWYAGVSK
ncbi:MAG: class I SAM-dependent methyltransferase [Rhodospirillaceae bacterium]|nr:class I SAM-dependent methyltransferase [Rhodospirillaceae bacterium]